MKLGLLQQAPRFLFAVFPWSVAGLAVVLSVVGVGTISALWQGQARQYDAERTTFQLQFADVQKRLTDLENEDQVVINRNLTTEIKNIQSTYGGAVDVYEDFLRLREQTKDTGKFDTQFAGILSLLSKRNYASASAQIADLKTSIARSLDKLAASMVVPASVPANNTPPDAGFRQQTVNTNNGSFLVDIVAADLHSTRVIVDTASATDCNNNCPVLPLADYVARNGAFAGINGTFFCPAEYPSCAGRTNSFDTLLMNKNKYYFNSTNNVYSTVPLVFFSGNSMGVRTQSLNWGRDTGVDSVIAMQPLLVYNRQVTFGGSGESKFASKGTRNFIGNKGSTVYIGTIFSATMADAAQVASALGLGNALNLDEGGSTALWYSGYKAGPGRNIPNAILFVSVR